MAAPSAVAVGPSVSGEDGSGPKGLDKSELELVRQYEQATKFVVDSLDMYQNDLLAMLYPVFAGIFVSLVQKGHTAAAQAFLADHRQMYEGSHGPDLDELSAVTGPEQLSASHDTIVARLANHVSRFHVIVSDAAFALFVRHAETTRNSSTKTGKTLIQVFNESVKVERRTPDATLATARTLSQKAGGSVVYSDVSGFAVESRAPLPVQKGFEMAVGSAAAASMRKQSVKWGVLQPADQSQLVLNRSRKRRRKLSQAGDAHLPDYTKDHSLDILTRLSHNPAVRPPGAVPQDEADRRACLPLDSVTDISCACLTVLNTYRTMLCSTVSLDASMVAAGFDDSTVKVWSMSGVAVGTPFGSTPGGVAAPAADVDMRSGAAAEAAAGVATRGGRSRASFGEFGAGRDGGAGAGGGSRSARRDGATAAPAVTDGSDGEAVVLRGHAGPVFTVSFAPDNEYLLSGGEDCTIRMWDLASRSCLTVFRGHRGPVWDVRFGPHGFYFVSSSRDTSARLWCTTHPSWLRLFGDQLRDAECACLHPNLHYVLTGSADKLCRLYEMESGKCVRVFTGHTDRVTDVAFTTGGRYAAASSASGFVILWDLHNGERVAALTATSRACINTIAISRDDAFLVAGFQNCSVAIWDLDVPLHGSAPVDADASATPSGKGPASGTAVTPAAGGGGGGSSSGGGGGGGSGGGGSGGGGGDSATISAAAAALEAHAAGIESAVVKAPAGGAARLSGSRPPSLCLARSYRTKRTPVFAARFTPRNLLVVAGPYIRARAPVLLRDTA